MTQQNYGPSINGVPIADLMRQRDVALVELLALRAAIHDLGIQDADDSWYAAVARADAFMDTLISSARERGPICAVCSDECSTERATAESTGTSPTATTVLAEFIEDPYASGRFENLGCQGLPEDVYNELLRVAAHKHVSVYYLAAIYKRGQADGLAFEEDGDLYLWERCYACGHRLAFASDSCPQCGIHFVDGEDPPNWPEKCACERCTEAREAR